MNLASTFAVFSPRAISQGNRNVVRDAWDGLARVPGGARVFSRMLGLAAPYTGTIPVRVEDLRLGHARVTLRDCREVRNHLSCIHAVALVNLAELTGNLAVVYSLPNDARFIVAGLSTEYLKKARGTITATSDIDPIRTSERREYAVPVEMRDASGEVVARASLRTLVGPKPPT
jgi:acyl-coenzyme A thioesterase PaaI-like protein